MKKIFLTIACLVMAGLIATPFFAGQASSDKEAVRLTLLDYVEGIYNGQPERIERSVHPKLAKLGFYRPPAETAYRGASPMSFERLIEVAKNFNKDGKLPKDAPKEITLFEIQDQTATAKLVADWGTDYFHLAKFDGKWMIVNVLWQSPPPKKS